MRRDTRVFMGVKHVGGPRDNVEPKELAVEEAARLMVRMLAQITMAKSLNFYVARSYEDCRALMSRGEKSALQEQEQAAEDSEFADVFKEFMDGED